MKKGIVLAVAIVSTLIGHSQIRIGVYGAGSLSKAFFTKEEGLTTKSKPVFAPAGGVVADIPLSGQFSVRPSLGFIQKGVKATATGTDGTVTGIIKSDLKMNYAELPVLLTFKKQAGNTTLLFGAGPSFGFGLGGKIKTTSYLDNIPDPLLSFEANPFKKSDHIEQPFSRFEFSGAGMLGVELKNGLFFSANYLHGFSNISGDAPDYKFRNRTVSVSVGYFFGARK
jgi:hypothetical protein